MLMEGSKQKHRYGLKESYGTVKFLKNKREDSFTHSFIHLPNNLFIQMFTECLLNVFLAKLNLNGRGTSSTVTGGEKKLR